MRYPTTMMQSQYGMHQNYIYHPSYMQTAAGLLPMTHSALNPTAAALSAAGQQAYYDYTSAAAAYPATYQTAAQGMESYAAAAAVSAASAMSQYAAAVPGYSWSLPPAATAAAAAAAAAGMSPYQTAQPQLQEARMQ
ncbi:hypothetical protein GWK47_037873 [Chionoecetes opilio]|uniref:Uncharacterized protein n=1 Tax=Chionoecetes opilio TaxID=41210 RepID=A0A8J4YD82_CHIOP|nr:hypothetical protein GWK47_037873 [Chionoecetes opilio]